MFWASQKAAYATLLFITMKQPKDMTCDELFFEALRLLQQGHRDVAEASSGLKLYSSSLADMEQKAYRSYQHVTHRYNAQAKKLLQ